MYDAVDGSEIRRSPVEVGSWNPIIYQVLAPSNRWLVGNGISEPSTVPWGAEAHIMAIQPNPP